MFDNKDISSLTMVGKILLICLVVAFAGHSLSIFEAHHQSSHIFNGRYKLQADNGEFLTLCLTGCGPTASSGTPVAAIRSEDCANSVWKIENNGATVTMRGHNKNYLTRCGACWAQATNPYSVTVHVTDYTSQYAQWTPEAKG